MSAISLKSITGITSITTPSGVDNVFTVHTNDTTERFRVDQTGNLNIAGIVTVTKDLDVDGHTNLDNVSIVGVTTFNGLSSNDVIRVRSADSNGNSVVNILSEGTTGNSRILFSDTAATSGDGWISYSHNDRALTFATAGTSNERLRITSTGYLKVTNGSTSDFNTIQRASTTNYSGIRIQDADATQRMQIGVAGATNNIANGSAQHDVVLKSYANLLLATNQTERLRIHSDGKMSLGTSSSASAKFNISHGNELALYTSGPYNYQAKFESTDAEAAIVIEDVNSGSNYNRIGVITNDMTFITNNNERLRIKSTGKMGIGTDNPNRTLSVKSNGGQFSIIDDDDSKGQFYCNAGTVSMWATGGSSIAGNLDFATTPSGGSTATRMQIDSTGTTTFYGDSTGTEQIKIQSSGGGTGIYIGNFQGIDAGDASSRLGVGKNDNALIFTNASGSQIQNFAIGNTDSIPLVFSTANTKRLVITGAGQLQHQSGSGVSYFNGASEYIFGSTNSSPPSGGNEANVQIHTSKTRASFSINAYQNNAGAPFMQFVSSRSGTVGTLGTVANNNDYLGDIRFCGDDGAGGVATGATIQVRAKTSATTNGMAARIEFATAKDSSSNTRQVFSMGEGGAFTGEADTAALYGYHTSLNNTNKYVDLTQWTRDSFIILELFGGINPNSSGSGAYNDPVHMYIYKGTGWTGSRVGHYIYCVSVAPPARHAFPSGTGYSGNAQISAVWTDGSSNLGNETATSTNYIRLLIPNANNSNSFTKSFRIFRRR